MAVIQSASFPALDVQKVRVGAYSNESAVQTVIEQTSHNYESLIGVKVPEATTIAATPHVHDGTNGALNRQPLITQNLNVGVNLFDGGSAGDRYALGYFPFFAPEGVTSIDLRLGLSGPQTEMGAERTYFLAYDSSMNEQSAGESTGTYKQEPIGNSDKLQQFIEINIAVDEGALNVIRIEFENHTDDSHNQTFGWQYKWIYAVPGGTTNTVGTPYVDPPSTNTDTIVPSGTEYAGSYAHTSFDEHLVDQDRGVTPFHLQGCMKNNALAYQILTGKPAGRNASGHTNRASHTGHIHKDNSADFDEIGAHFDQQLFSHSYGGDKSSAAVLNTANIGTGIRAFKHVGASTGHGNAHQVAVHHFRLPALKDADVDGTSILKFAALLETESGKSVQPLIRLRVANIAIGGISTAGDNDYTGSAGAGLELVTGQVDVSSWASGPGDGVLCRADIYFGISATGDTPFLHGCCMYLEP